MDRLAEKRGLNAAQKARVENAGVLTASGLIAGEALMGLAWPASWPGSRRPRCRGGHRLPAGAGLAAIAPWLAIPVMLFLIAYLARRPLGKAGAPDEPAPPTAVM